MMSERDRQTQTATSTPRSLLPPRGPLFRIIPSLPGFAVKLTPRELQLLTLSWFSGPELAARLGITVGRIKMIRSNFYAKLHITGTANKRTLCAIYACQIGLLSPDDFIIGRHPGVV